MRYKEPASIIRIGARFSIYSNTTEVIILEAAAPITAIIIITDRKSEAKEQHLYLVREPDFKAANGLLKTTKRNDIT